MLPKKCAFIFASTFFISVIYAQSIFSDYYMSPASVVRLNDDYTGCTIHDNSEYNQQFNFRIEKENGLTYIDFLDEKGIYDIGSKTYTKKILLLSGYEQKKDGSFTSLAFGYSEQPYKKDNHFEFIRPYNMAYNPGNAEYEDCSSYLIEGNVEYKVSNLGDFDFCEPWVEAATGDGIGEGFTIKPSYNCPYLLIMNGYISYDKPYLYTQNARVKQLKITGLQSGVSKVLDLYDTPNPQSIDISFLKDDEKYRVEIYSVYQGTKYQDTCLSMCLPYRYKVIPCPDIF